MARLQLSLLGTFRATLDGAPLTAFGYDKVRALLAYLAVECDRPHHRESLAGLLWPEQPEQTARLNLSQALSRLRRAIGDKRADAPFIDVTRQTLQFNPASDHWLDAVAFTQALDACAKHRHERLEGCGECLERLEGAAALYQGLFLEGFSIADSAPFEEWALLHRERLHRLAQETLHRLARCYAASGEYEKALPHAWRQVELDAWREAAQRQLMRLLALSGQRGAALAQYEVCRRLLAEELDVEPAEETTRLYERIVAAAIAAPAAISAPPPHNLPPESTPFVGRKDELSNIRRRLNDPDCRLLSLVGPGGIGKTRLAIQTARDVIRAAPKDTSFEHGVTYVPLVTVSTPDALVATIASALGFTFYPGTDPKQQLFDYLRGKEMLLLLDNFEQLLAPAHSLPEAETETSTSSGGGAELVADILASAPRVKLLITSREALNLQQEWFQPVGGMAFPSADVVEEVVTISADQYSAVALFLQCARRARPGFSLTEEVRWVVRICQLVEGMPLAIELATAWLKALPISRIAKELEEDLEILSASMRDVPARHKSMRVVFDHSWNRLSERERAVMGALSVFRGGFQMEAALAVTGASLAHLAGLVEKSMLSTVPGDRYQMHELLRQYAAGKLEEEPDAVDAVHDRHCAYFAAALEAWAYALKGPRQQTALEEMKSDARNARKAWSWAGEHRHAARLDQAMDGLCHFYAWCARFREGEAACRELAAQLRPAAQASAHELRTLARCRAWQGFFQRTLGHIPRAGELLRKSLDLLANPALARHDTRACRAFILREMGHIAAFSDREQARALGEESLALYRALDDRWGMASVLYELAAVAYRLTAYDEAQRLLEEALDIRRSLGDRMGTADSLTLLAMVFQCEELLDESERLTQESIVVSQQIGNRSGAAEALMTLATTRSYFQGKYVEAQALCEEAATTFDELGRRRLFGIAKHLLGWMSISLGLYGQAQDLFQTSFALFEEMSEREMIGRGLLGESALALVKEDYEAARTWAEKSAAMMQEIGQKNVESTAFGCMAIAAMCLGEHCQARALLREALGIAVEIRALDCAMESIATAALLLAGAGDAERAVELYALAFRYPFIGNSHWWEDVAGKNIASTAATLPPDIVATCQDRGRTRDLWETAEALLDELRAL